MFVLALLLALALLAGLLWIWSGQRRLDEARRLFEQDVGSLDLSSFALPPVPEADNAAHWVLEASHATVVPDRQAQRFRDLVRTPVDRWTEADLELARRIVYENEPALELFRRALDTERTSFGIDYTQGVDAPTPDRLTTMIGGARLLRLEAKLALHAGEPDRALDALGALGKMADALGAESFLLTTLFETAILNRVTEVAHEVVALGVRDRELLRRAKSLLESPDPGSTMRRAFRAEATLAAVTPVTRWVDHDAEWLPWWSRWLLEQTELRMRAAILDDYRRMVEALEKPWSHFHRQTFEPDFWTQRSPLWPSIVDSLERLESTQTARALGRAAIDLWTDRLEGEPYPQMLSPEELSTDTFSGEPVVYERHADGTGELSAPSAIRLWREYLPGASQREMPPFTWQLPAPTGVPVGR